MSMKASRGSVSAARNSGGRGAASVSGAICSGGGVVVTCGNEAGRSISASLLVPLAVHYCTAMRNAFATSASSPSRQLQVRRATLLFILFCTWSP
jgi:hypothetical protein